MDPLVTALKRIRRRLVAVRAAEVGLAGLLVAAAPALVLTALRIVLPRVLPAAWTHPAAALALLPAGFLAAFAVRYLVGTSLHTAARAADRAAGLDDRLASALERKRSQESFYPSGKGRLEPFSELDPFLLADARRAAADLDPRRLRLSRSLGRRGRAALAAAVVLAGLALVPSRAGPPVDRPSAERAAAALAPLAEDTAVAPAVRDAIERAVDRLRRPGARRGDAARATGAVYEAAGQARRAREQTAKALASAEVEEMRTMVRSARAGDGAGAAAAADDLADRLSRDATAGGLMPAARKRLADTLDAASPHAREAGVVDLDRTLTDAAKAIRSEDTERARSRLADLAASMARHLGPEGGATVAAAVEAVDRARRAMGLPPAAAPAVGRPLAEAGDVDLPEGEAAGAPPDAAVGETGEGVPAAGVPDTVRPQDRDVVRRYFGG